MTGDADDAMPFGREPMSLDGAIQVDMFDSEARVPTPNASRYLQQLCKHWSQNVAVEFDATHGKVVIPKDARGADWPADAVITMLAEADRLICRIAASSGGQLVAMKDVLQQHLDRFAFRETPLAFDWTTAASAGPTDP